MGSKGLPSSQSRRPTPSGRGGSKRVNLAPPENSSQAICPPTYPQRGLNGERGEGRGLAKRQGMDTRLL